MTCPVALRICCPLWSPKREGVPEVISTPSPETLMPLGCPLLPEVAVPKTLV